KVQRAVLGHAAIEQACDAGVIETGEDLPLEAEALEEDVAEGLAGDYFDGHALFELAVKALRGINSSHATLAHGSLHFVRSEAPVGLDAVGRGNGLQQFLLLVGV